MLFFPVPPFSDRGSSGLQRSQTWMGCRRASTLIELMIAFGILATAISVVMGMTTNVQQLQAGTQARELASITAYSIANRYSGASVKEISTWIANGRMVAEVDSPRNTWCTLADLQRLNLVAPQIGYFSGDATGDQAQRMRFTVGFYRVLHNTDSAGNLIPGANQSGICDVVSPTSLESVAVQLIDRSRPLAATLPVRNLYRVSNPSLVVQVSDKKPVAILVLAWMLDQNPAVEPRLLQSVVGMVGTP